MTQAKEDVGMVYQGKGLYKKYKEMARYLFAGVLTTIISLGICYLCVILPLDPGSPVPLQLTNIPLSKSMFDICFIKDK